MRTRLRYELKKTRCKRLAPIRFAGKDRKEYDEWITVGREHYQNAGLWMQFPESHHQQVANFFSLNHWLQMGKYIEILQNSEPIGVSGCRDGDRRYFLLRFSPIETHVPEFPDAFKNLGCELYLWIDATTHRISRAQSVVTAKMNRRKIFTLQLCRFFQGTTKTFKLICHRVK